MGLGESSFFAGGSTVTAENSAKVSPKAENRFTTRSSYVTLVYICPKDSAFFYLDIYSSIFIAALLHRKWQQPRCPSTDEGIMKRWSIYRMKYYSTVKRNEVVKFSSQWMKQEIIILSEVVR